MKTAEGGQEGKQREAVVKIVVQRSRCPVWFRLSWVVREGRTEEQNVANGNSTAAICRAGT